MARAAASWPRLTRSRLPCQHPNQRNGSAGETGLPDQRGRLPGQSAAASNSPKKRDADAFATKAAYEVSQGVHTSDGVSITISKADENWLARGARENLKRSTITMYEQHLRLHINPFLGARRLNQLTKPMVEDYRDQLLESGRSRAMARKILGSLSSLVKGSPAQGPRRAERGRRRRAEAIEPRQAKDRAAVERAYEDDARRGGKGSPNGSPVDDGAAFCGPARF